MEVEVPWTSSANFGLVAERLAAIADPRALAALDALRSAPRPDRATLDRLLRATDPEVAALEQLAALSPPDPEDARRRLDALLDAALAVDDSRHARELDDRAADLVRAAVAWHDEHGDRPCPLCGTGQLGPGWRGWAEIWLTERRAMCERAAEAVARLSAAEEAARELTRPISIPRAHDVDTSRLACALAELAAVSDLRAHALVAALEAGLDRATVELEAVSASARSALAARGARSREISEALALLIDDPSTDAAEGCDPSGRPAHMVEVGDEEHARTSPRAAAHRDTPIGSESQTR